MLEQDRTDYAGSDDRPLRHAVEARHASFTDPAFVRICRDHGVAVVLADTAGRYPVLRETTADFVYVRLHGSSALYSSDYTDEELETWAAKLSRWTKGPDGRDVYVYFDNDAKVHAPYNAMQLGDLIGL